VRQFQRMSERFRFGLFVFDAETSELTLEGIPVRLQAQPAQVLAYLLRSAGRVVSRDQLVHAIWGDATRVDFERGLNFCIAQVRSALKDDPAAPRYIRTIPRSGYQFIAPVEQIDAAFEARSRPISAAPKMAAGRIAALFVGGLLLLLIAAAVGYWLRSIPSVHRGATIAVVHFDNETSDPVMARFADGLTDNVVAQLFAASGQKFQVIGNAAILRVPRDQRDLSAIATSLRAAYVVLGQVQSNGSQTRILAHLIRMPDQTHLWVVRSDLAIADPLAAETQTAQKIAAEFSPRIIEDSTVNPLPPLANR